MTTASNTDSTPRLYDYSQAPAYAKETAALFRWSENYDAGKGPATLFLDLIGYSMDEFGTTLYSLADSPLGYLECEYLGDALKEYAERPQDIREWIEEVLAYEAGDDSNEDES